MKMKLSLTALFIIAGTLSAQAVGPVYTIPADYEKMKKAVEGLIGKKTNEVSLDEAQKRATNVRTFVESASEHEGDLGADTSEFRNAGRNYLSATERMVGADINSSNNYSTGGYTDNTPNAYYYYGSNVRNFMEGVTGKSAYENNADAYENAGKNIKSFMEGIGGSSYPITGANADNYKYAGQNLATIGKELSGGTEVTTSDTSGFQTKVSNFKKRADQTFYDTYLNDKGLKKSFTFASGFDPTKYKSGLTTITKKNEVGSLGGGGLDDTFVIECEGSNMLLNSLKCYILTPDGNQSWTFYEGHQYYSPNKTETKTLFGHEYKVVYKTTYHCPNISGASWIAEVYRDGIKVANVCGAENGDGIIFYEYKNVKFIRAIYN